MAATHLGPRVIILGSGAGGGSPQWNCNCSICRRVRRGETGTRSRTQTSLAVTADGERWVLINASPDVRQQIAQTPALAPASDKKRHSPIEAVVLTGGEVDQVAGLLTMREREAFSLYASSAIHNTLNQSPIFNVLNRDLVPRRVLRFDREELVDSEANPLGVTIEPFGVPGKIPLYQETPGEEPAIGGVTEENLALRVDLGQSHFYFIPGCADLSPELLERLDGAPLLLFDGTLWRDDELIASELGQKTGHRMGHISIDGPDGTISKLANLDIETKIFIHINNSNPVLVEDSEERGIVEEAGWQVAFDGMELSF